MPTPVRLLVVDDSREMRDSVVAFCRRAEGIEVVGSAASASEAFDMVSRLTVDVVLMDIRMPGINGLEATQQLLLRPDAPRVVLFTFDEPELYEEAARAAGAHGFLRKSELWNELLPTVRGFDSRRSI
jgi:DNA-binding NarL/FixJ family response regulator